MRMMRPMLLMMAVVLAMTLPQAVSAAKPPQEPELQYVEALNRGIQAYRRGEMNQAVRAFEEAYLIRPNDPELLSWMALVRDQQGRGEAMTRALKEVDQRRAKYQAAVPEESPDLLQQRLTLPTYTPQGLDGTVTPVGESRQEVLTSPTRAGFQKLYKEGIGFQPIRGLGFSARTEIYDEPNPVDDYILETKILNFREISQFRRSITPLFVRSAAWRATIDYEPLPRFTYEYDARQTLHEFETRYGFKDINRQSHSVNALYSFPRIPYIGVLTLNPWYKRLLQGSDHDVGANEQWNELIMNVSLQQTDDIEYFFQMDMYDSHKKRVVGRTKLKEFRGEARLRVPPLKLFLIPGYDYTDEDFDPGDDEFSKRKVFVDWGFDITDRLRASSKEEVISDEVSQSGKTPSNPQAETLSMVNTLSYELFKDFDVSFGVDYAKGFGYSNYNNVGLRAEIELFKPGIIRSKLGYEWISYYNISSDLSLLYWKFFLFM